VFAVVSATVVYWLVTKSRFAQPIQRAFSGRQLNEVEAFLQEIAEFKSE
jgi:hypothetical protein